jgi:pilus assembly protein CpaB
VVPRFRRPRSLAHTARRAAAVLLAVLALVLAVRPPPRTTAAEDPSAVPATVAVADLPPGAVLTPSDLAVARFPAALVPAGVVADPAALSGRVLAGGVRAGEPITDVRLVGAGLTALLPEGQVAAPVRLADLAVAALVRTGDHVDVLATPADARTAEVVVASALVLAAPANAADAAQDPAGGLLLLAVDGVTAARLAATAAGSTLTVSLPRP